MGETGLDRMLFDRRTFLKGGLALGGLAAVSGCGKSSTSASSTSSGGKLTYDIENPTGIEPYTLEDENAVSVAFQLFEPLTFYDFEKGELQPLVAESWSVNDTSDEWTFKIRQGITFHDGTTVNAKSFKYGWERLCNPNSADTPSALSYHLAMIEGYDDAVNGTADSLAGVTCPDDYTLQVKLSIPYADFGYVCSAPVLSPIPECAKDNYSTYALAPVGNGPFKMKDTWVDGQYIEIERYDGYWGDKPLIDSARFSIYRDSMTAFKELQAGSLDCSIVPANQTKTTIQDYGEAENNGYTAQPGKQFFSGTMYYTQYLVFNVGASPISDIRVRQALSLSVNRQAICDNIYEGSATPAGDIMPEAIEGSDQTMWEYASYDIDKAKALLDEAGYTADANGKRDLSIELMTNAANAQEEYESMQSDWSALGLDVTINKIEYAAMLDNYLSGNFQVAARGWYADYPIQDNYLYPLFYSSSSDNMSHYSSAEFDAAITAARAITDHDARVAAMKEVDRLVANDLPIVPLNYKSLSRCASKRTSNFTVSPQILPYLSKASLSE